MSADEVCLYRLNGRYVVSTGKDFVGHSTNLASDNSSLCLPLIPSIVYTKTFVVACIAA